jgi:hypothetical protein
LKAGLGGLSLLQGSLLQGPELLQQLPASPHTQTSPFDPRSAHPSQRFPVCSTTQGSVIKPAFSFLSVVTKADKVFSKPQEAVLLWKLSRWKHGPGRSSGHVNILPTSSTGHLDTHRQPEGSCFSSGQITDNLTQETTCAPPNAVSSCPH